MYLLKNKTLHVLPVKNILRKWNVLLTKRASYSSVHSIPMFCQCFIKFCLWIPNSNLLPPYILSDKTGRWNYSTSERRARSVEGQLVSEETLTKLSRFRQWMSAQESVRGGDEVHWWGRDIEVQYFWPRGCFERRNSTQDTWRRAQDNQ